MGCCYALTFPGSETCRLLVPDSAASGLLRSRPPAAAARLWAGSVRLRARAVAVEEREPAVSFYELLGIPESGGLPEIKQAYKQLARKYHPDVCPDPDRVEEYTRTFIRVQEAYETLSDPWRRAVYDRDMSRGIHLAFSARRRYCQPHSSLDLEDKAEWKSRWQSQVSELKKRSVHKDAGNMSWGARMRQQREELSEEL